MSLCRLFGGLSPYIQGSQGMLLHQLSPGNLQQRTDSQHLPETSPITEKCVQTALKASCDTTMSQHSVCSICF